MADRAADYVAVYGSLRRGQAAETKMQRMEFVGQGAINASLYALGWYPGVKLGEGVTIVDVFKLPEDEHLREAILFDLDNYEGYSPRHPENSLFVRRVVNLSVPVLPFTRESKHPPVYVYEYNYPVNRAPLVKSGDWNEYNPPASVV